MRRHGLVAVLIGAVFAASGPPVAHAQEGSGPDGTVEGPGMTLEWHVAGADVGTHFYAERTWQAPGTVTSTRVRFSGVMKTWIDPTLTTDSSMSAYVSLPFGVGQKQVEWHGTLGKDTELQHELPFAYAAEFVAWANDVGVPVLAALIATGGGTAVAALAAVADVIAAYVVVAGVTVNPDSMYLPAKGYQFYAYGRTSLPYVGPEQFIRDWVAANPNG